MEGELGLHLQLRTPTTALLRGSWPQAPLQNFPHSTVPTPNFLIVLVSGPLDSFGSVMSHLVSEKSNLVVEGKEKSSVFSCCLEGG